MPSRRFAMWRSRNTPADAPLVTITQTRLTPTAVSNGRLKTSGSSGASHRAEGRGVGEVCHPELAALEEHARGRAARHDHADEADPDCGQQRQVEDEREQRDDQ